MKLVDNLIEKYCGRFFQDSYSALDKVLPQLENKCRPFCLEYNALTNEIFQKLFDEFKDELLKKISDELNESITKSNDSANS